MFRTTLFAAALCALALRCACAAEAGGSGPVTPQPKPGCIFVRSADGAGTAELPVSLLQPHTQYHVHFTFYRDPQAQTALLPGHPLSPEAVEVEDDSTVLLGDGVLTFMSSDRKLAVRPPGAGQPPAGHAAADPEPAVHYGSFIMVYGPQASRGLDNPDGPADGAQKKLVALGDHVAAGGLDFYINCPAANRYELYIERAEVPGEQLQYTPGQALPQALRGADPQFAPYAWQSGTLRAVDAGYLFSDGTAAPEK